MSNEGNRALARTLSGKRAPIGRLSVGGFERLRTPAQALDEALFGKWVAGWYVVGYGWAVALAFFIVFNALDRLNAGAVIVLAIGVAFVALGVVLGLAVSSRQARWASVVLAIWAAYECVKTGVPLLYGFLNWAFLANLACLFYALRSVRGCFALARMRRANRDTVETFA